MMHMSGPMGLVSFANSFLSVWYTTDPRLLTQVDFPTFMIKGYMFHS